MKKLISLIIAALMVAALVIPVLADTEEAQSTADDTPSVGVSMEDETDALPGDEAKDAEEGDESADEGEILTTGAEEGSTDDESEDVASASSDEGTVISVEGAPDYVVKSDEEYMNYDFSSVFDDDGHFKGIRALDYVDLKNYENIHVSKEALDSKIDGIITSLLESYAAPAQVTDRAVKDGDTINIDYTGYIDGEAFENGSTEGNGSTVTIGKTSMIDGFLDQIVGHEPGETFDINVTFPEDYENEEVAGKPATFSVTVNYIEGETVTPELTDEFVAENITPQNESITTKDELIKYYEESESVKSSLIIDRLIEENPISELPSAAYTFAVDLSIVPFANYASQYGVDVGTFMTIYGYTYESVVTSYAEDNIKTAKRMLIVQAIDEARADISVTEDAMKEFATENFGSEDYTDAAGTYGIGLLKMYVLQDVVMDYVTERATFDGAPVGSTSIIIAACVAGAAVLVIVVILIVRGGKKKDAGTEENGSDADTDGNGEEGAAEEDAPPMINLADLLGTEAAEKAEQTAEDTVEEVAEDAAEEAAEETAENTAEEAVEET